jgi:hypothetical protein
MDTAPPLPSLSIPAHPAVCGEDCCTGGSAIAAAALDTGRPELIRRAFRLEYATVAWMVVEAVIAVWSGVHARSVSLLAFGIDSLIELASAGVLLRWTE